MTMRWARHVKGAAQTLAQMCDVDAEAVGEREERLAAEGYRVLAVQGGGGLRGPLKGAPPRSRRGGRFFLCLVLFDPVPRGRWRPPSSPPVTPAGG